LVFASASALPLPSVRFAFGLRLWFCSCFRLLLPPSAWLQLSDWLRLGLAAVSLGCSFRFRRRFRLRCTFGVAVLSAWLPFRLGCRFRLRAAFAWLPVSLRFGLRFAAALGFAAAFGLASRLGFAAGFGFAASVLLLRSARLLPRLALPAAFVEMLLPFAHLL
jgi:hypothetical protein